ncbi:WD-40 repeat protein [Reticulomyxa filosa]|uniref:WD-40 repeat protein n=1 Tax=Reticulomyxa filosa TaxID=46433 RepID=X6MZ03_RETFI|nr:WD-40 repeat protein [Reticulomyxa filosa]|eukprot:ETO18290.1 WD-40 repeat protein [Reticulomyxa filosa]
MKNKLQLDKFIKEKRDPINYSTINLINLIIRYVICFSSIDETILFWDMKNNQQSQIFNKYISPIYGIEFSPFNCDRYLFFGSRDKTIHLCDVGTSKILHIFNGHENCAYYIDISQLQSNNNNGNSTGTIGGNGCTICSGSNDETIQIWDIETTKRLIVFKGYECSLWDIRSGQQIQIFKGHTGYVHAVDYSPFVINNKDNTISFWDIRTNNELYMTQGDEREDKEIYVSSLFF